uniref:Transmembrane protein n=1 Tax=Chromera velia CCMP2878 TaxID=1169474 RepID=A0A0G4I351_9ALVE|eukprot:Cvel_10569.t1-p1 / transcript=Cvel_10569.t1 / gene=Cvel_10569 / organism=Chromera_velia_CCMP2878 / gene_product=hypothetical protein / transcript_product=hypothetical protein / location=Cvel_scaffold640:36974-40534(-) / protein_length=488 / sequence_SO=supercontig / SO=protein_coding / is_pseudo=false
MRVRPMKWSGAVAILCGLLMTLSEVGVAVQTRKRTGNSQSRVGRPVPVPVGTLEAGSFGGFSDINSGSGSTSVSASFLTEPQEEDEEGLPTSPSSSSFSFSETALSGTPPDEGSGGLDGVADSEESPVGGDPCYAEEGQKPSEQENDAQDSTRTHGAEKGKETPENDLGNPVICPSGTRPHRFKQKVCVALLVPWLDSLHSDASSLYLEFRRALFTGDVQVARQICEARNVKEAAEGRKVRSCMVETRDDEFVKSLFEWLNRGEAESEGLRTAQAWRRDAQAQADPEAAENSMVEVEWIDDLPLDPVSIVVLHGNATLLREFISEMRDYEAKLGTPLARQSSHWSIRPPPPPPLPSGQQTVLTHPKEQQAFRKAFQPNSALEADTQQTQKDQSNDAYTNPNSAEPDSPTAITFWGGLWPLALASIGCANDALAMYTTQKCDPWAAIRGIPHPDELYEMHRILRESTVEAQSLSSNTPSGKIKNLLEHY